MTHTLVEKLISNGNIVNTHKVKLQLSDNLKNEINTGAMRVYDTEHFPEEVMLQVILEEVNKRKILAYRGSGEILED